MSEVLLTRLQVAAILNVSLTTLYRWDRDGILVAMHVGGVVRYRPEDVEALAREGRRAEARTA